MTIETSPALLEQAEQAELWNCPCDESDGVGLPLDEQRHRFTGERFMRNQEKRAAVVRAMGQGLGVRFICETFRVSPNTLLMLREQHPELVETEKKRWANLYGFAARLSVESFIEDLSQGRVPSNVKWVASCAFFDKKALADGDLTAIVEHRERVATPEELNAAARRIELMLATVIDCESIVASPNPLCPNSGSAIAASGAADQTPPIMPPDDGSPARSTVANQSPPAITEGEGGGIESARSSHSVDATASGTHSTKDQ